MYKLLIAACIIWGLNVLVVKEMLNYAPMFFLASVRIWITCFALLCLCKVKNLKIFTYNSNVFLVGLLVVVLNFICTFIGMETSGSSFVALINGLTPFITMVFLRQAKDIFVNKYSLIALFCCVLSIVISFDYSSVGSLYNTLFLVLGLCFYSKGNVIMKNVINKDNYFVYTLQYQFIGAILLSLLSFSYEYGQVISVSSIPINLLILFLLFSGFGFAFIQIVYSKSIYDIGPVKTSYFFSLNPIVTYVGAFLLLGESISFNMILALFLLLISIFLLNYSKK